MIPVSAEQTTGNCFCRCCVLFLQFKWSKLHQTKHVIPHLEWIWLVSLQLEAMVTRPKEEDDEATHPKAVAPNLFCATDWFNVGQ